MLSEDITKAVESIALACGDLKSAHTTAEPVAELILAELHRRSVALLADVRRFEVAIRGPAGSRRTVL